MPSENRLSEKPGSDTIEPPILDDFDYNTTGSIPSLGPEIPNVSSPAQMLIGLGIFLYGLGLFMGGVGAGGGPGAVKTPIEKLKDAKQKIIDELYKRINETSQRTDIDSEKKEELNAPVRRAIDEIKACKLREANNALNQLYDIETGELLLGIYKISFLIYLVWLKSIWKKGEHSFKERNTGSECFIQIYQGTTLLKSFKVRNNRCSQIKDFIKGLQEKFDACDYPDESDADGMVTRLYR
jgi:hypothetical protein